MRAHLLLLVPCLLSTASCIDTTGLVFGGGDYQSEVLKDQPVGYWPLDTLDDTMRTSDISGGERHARADNNEGVGAVSAGMAGATGATGSAITLSTTGSLNVGLPHPFGAGASAYTFEAWLRIDDNRGVARLWTALAEDFNGPGYSATATANYLSYKRYDVDNMSEGLVADSDFLGAFHHVVVTHDGVEESQVYIDGMPIFSPLEPLAVTWTESVGKFVLAGASTSGTMTIDEVAVYDVVLSSARIQRHFDCARGCD